MRYIFLCSIILSFRDESNADQICTSLGSDFVLGFMGTYTPEMTDLYLIVTNDNEVETEVYIEIPLQNSTNSSFVPPKSSKKISVGWEVEVVEKRNAMTLSTVNRGIHVSSELPIRLFAGSEDAWDLNITSVTPRYSIDGCLVLPTQSLGTEYLAITLPGTRDVHPYQIIAVAVEDETTVSFQHGAMGEKRNTTVLNRLQILQFAAMQPLTGVQISADKPVAVFSGNQWGKLNNGFDFAVTMPLPRKCWGTEYVAMSMYLGNTSNKNYWNQVNVVTDSNETALNLLTNGNYSKVTINAFQFLNLSLSSGGWTHISSNNLVFVSEMGDYVGEMRGVPDAGSPSLSMVIPISAFIHGEAMFSTFGFFKPYDYQWLHFVNIVVRNEHTSQILFDGTNVSNWKILGSSGYSGVIIQNIPHGSHVLFCRNCSYYAMSYGYDKWTQYSFAIGTGNLSGQTFSHFISLGKTFALSKSGVKTTAKPISTTSTTTTPIKWEMPLIIAGSVVAAVILAVTLVIGTRKRWNWKKTDNQLPTTTIQQWFNFNARRPLPNIPRDSNATVSDRAPTEGDYSTISRYFNGNRGRRNNGTEEAQQRANEQLRLENRIASGMDGEESVGYFAPSSDAYRSEDGVSYDSAITEHNNHDSNPQASTASSVAYKSEDGEEPEYRELDVSTGFPREILNIC